jgi:hypothetical protein
VPAFSEKVAVESFRSSQVRASAEKGFFASVFTPELASKVLVPGHAADLRAWDALSHMPPWSASHDLPDLPTALKHSQATLPPLCELGLANKLGLTNLIHSLTQVFSKMNFKP